MTSTLLCPHCGGTMTLEWMGWSKMLDDPRPAQAVLFPSHCEQYCEGWKAAQRRHTRTCAFSRSHPDRCWEEEQQLPAIYYDGETIRLQGFRGPSVTMPATSLVEDLSTIVLSSIWTHGHWCREDPFLAFEPSPALAWGPPCGRS